MIHPEEVRGEQGSLVPAGAGPYFDDGVAVVEGIRWDEQLLQLLLQIRNFGLETLDVGLGQLDQLGVGFSGHFLSLIQLFGELIEAGSGASDFVQLGVLPAKLPEFFGVGGDRRVSELLVDFGRASKRGFEPRVQGYPSFSAVWVEYRCRKRSTRPAVSTRRCLPVKNG